MIMNALETILHLHVLVQMKYDYIPIPDIYILKGND